MPTQTLTTDFLRGLAERAPSRGATAYFDTEIKGFLLELRPKGRATYYYRYRDGDRQWRMCRIGSVDDTPLTEARQQAHQMRQMVLEGGDPKVERHRFRQSPKLADFVEQRYLPHARARKRSWTTDVALLRQHVLPYFGEYRLNRVRRADVLAFQDLVHERGYAAGTCNRMLALLKFLFNCAIRWELMPAGSNPCEGVPPLPEPGGRERYLSEAEVRRLFEELESNPNVQVTQVVKLLLYTGARKREILDARWEHVDFERRLLTVPLSKSGRPRHIPLSDAALALLRALPREADVPWVFFNPKTRKPPVSIFYAWDTIRRRAGLSDVRLHDLRHSFASFLVNAGRSLYEVKKLLGHYDPKVTMRYAHLAPAALIDAANIVGNIAAINAPAAEGLRLGSDRPTRSRRDAG